MPRGVYPRKTKPVREMIEDRSAPVPEAGCWLWTGATNRHGYGLVKRGKLAHRVAFAAFVMEIPAGMNVCHRCDTPACVNPAHLFLGTQMDNMRDMLRKGRGGQGDRFKNRTHCNNGHPLSGGNLILRPDGEGRLCRTCRNARARGYRNTNRSNPL